MATTDAPVQVVADSRDDVRALLHDYERGILSLGALIETLADFPFDHGPSSHAMLSPQWMAERRARDAGPCAFAWVTGPHAGERCHQTPTERCAAGLA
jgi:hypothetical protein